MLGRNRVAGVLVLDFVIVIMMVIVIVVVIMLVLMIMMVIALALVPGSKYRPSPRSGRALGVFRSRTLPRRPSRCQSG